MSDQTDITSQLVNEACMQLLQEEPVRALEVLANLTDVLEGLKRQKVAAMRRDGASWTKVGTALGVTRAAAWQRYGR